MLLSLFGSYRLNMLIVKDSKNYFAKWKDGLEILMERHHEFQTHASEHDYRIICLVR